jgi:hypothetical protein
MRGAKWLVRHKMVTPAWEEGHARDFMTRRACQRHAIERGIPTASARGTWQAVQVSRVLARLGRLAKCIDMAKAGDADLAKLVLYRIAPVMRRPAPSGPPWRCRGCGVRRKRSVCPEQTNPSPA